MRSKRRTSLPSNNGRASALPIEIDETFSVPGSAPSTTNSQCLSQCLPAPRNETARKQLQHGQRAPLLVIQDEKNPGNLSTAIDELLIEMLTTRIRVLSIDQVRDVAGGRGIKGRAAALRRVKRLESKGWVLVLNGLAHPELPLGRPVITWTPGETAPPFGPASYQLRSRWTLPPRLTQVVVASSVAGSFFGGAGGRVPRTSELTHDLALARIFIRLQKSDPKRASCWASEASLFERGEGRGDKLPDAMIKTRGGKVAVEFGGAYRPQKLREFHEYCSGRNLAYEIW